MSPEVTVSDILEIKTAITEIRGELRTMNAEIKSGDRDSASSVKLLAQNLEHVIEDQKTQRDDLKQALDKFDQRTDALRIAGEQQANAVRVSLESQLREHEHSEAPHARTLGARIDVLEDFRSRILGGFALTTLLGTAGVIGLIRSFFG